MSFLTQYLLSQGIPQEIIILVLILPITATVIVFARQIIGLKGFGVYIPLLIGFAFLDTGLKYGLMILITALLVGTLIRLLLKQFRLLYLPRMAIVLTGITIATLSLFSIAASFGQEKFTIIPAFSVLVIIALMEKFVAAQIERGTKETILLITETLALSIICYWIAGWIWLRDLVLFYPFWAILGSLIANAFLGKWTGLRLSEYIRFREVIKHVELPEKK
jgi:hypothetical protein